MSYRRQARLRARVPAAAAALLLAAAPPPVGAQLTANDRAALGDLEPQFAQRFELKRGWFRGRPIRYYDIGPQAVTIAPLFLVVSGVAPDGTPSPVPGQLPIFSSLPGLDGYSAIWQVQYLVVGPAYAPNALRDGREAVAMALRGEARLMVPGTFVNRPLVPAGSSLEGDPASRPLGAGWYKGREVRYFDFGLGVQAPAPIYAFVTGFANGEPRFLREQGNIVDVVPEGAGEYRDMWDVHFVAAPADYQADRIRDLTTLLAEAGRGALSVRRAAVFRNCPVVLVDGVPAARRALAP